MKNIIISTEIICIIFSFIFLYSVIVEDKRKNVKKTIFCTLTVSVILALFIDSLSYIVESYPEHKIMLHTLTILSLLMTGVQTTTLAYYIMVHINSMKKKSLWYAHIVAILNVANGIFTIAMSVSGKMYAIEDGTFIFQSMYNYLVCFAGCVLIYMIAIVLVNGKLLGTHDTISFLIYLLIPMAAAIIELMNNKWAFSYVSSAIALGFAFVMFQSKEINESRMREEVFKKVCNLDPLTELENRRAYDTFLARVSGKGGIGAIFCDLNGLKYTNDNLGHKEGDRLICDFANLLRKYFGNKHAFRISGDEFVVLMEDLEEDAFFGAVEEFREAVLEHDHISSLGSAYGEKDCVLELISMAEEAMYADKKYYYYIRGGCGRGCE